MEKKMDALTKSAELEPHEQARRQKWMLYLTFCILVGVPCCFLKVPYIMDEGVTLANTAALYGLDWADYVKEVGSYYFKYGYALLSFPVFWIDNPAIRYTAQLLMNVALMGLVPVMAYSIGEKHFQMKPGLRSFCLALSTGMLPAVAIEATLARGDVLLIVAVWAVLFFTLLCSEKKSHRECVLYTILVTLIACFAYMSHTRGIVVLLGLVLTVFAVKVFTGRSIVHIPIMMVTIAVLLGADYLISNVCKASIWRSTIRANTSESFSFSLLVNLGTLDGLKKFLRLGIGNTVSFGANTLLLGFIGVGIGLRHSLGVVLKKRNGQANVFGFMATLIFIGSALLGWLFLFVQVMRGSTSRGDWYIFTRYLSVAYGPMLFLGMGWLAQAKRERKCVIFTLVGAVLLAAVYQYVINPDLRGSARLGQGALPFLWFSDMQPPYTLFGGMKGAVLLYLVMAIFCFALLCCIKRRNAAVVMACIVISGMFYSVFTTIRWRDEQAFRAVTWNVIEAVDDMKSARVMYVDGSADVWVEGDYQNVVQARRSYQPLLPKIHVIGARSIDEEEDYLVVCGQAAYMDQASHPDTWLIEGFDYDTPERDVLLVHGKMMAQQLTDEGYHLYRLAE